MTKEQIDKLCKVGIRKKFNAVELSQYITRPPYNLSVAEASEVYYAFKNRHNSGSISKPVNCFPRPSRLAKKGPPITTVEEARAIVKVVGLSIVDGEFVQRTPSKLNRSAVKDFSMLAACAYRAGKFRRVSKSWVKQIEAEIENVIRGIGGASDSDDTIPGEWDFLNRKQIFAAVAEQLNRAVRKIILRKVRSYPSLGKTLK